jgi:hypothetical protein
MLYDVDKQGETKMMIRTNAKTREDLLTGTISNV